MAEIEKHNLLSNSRRSTDNAVSHAARAALFLFLFSVTLSGALEPLNLFLMDMRFRLLDRAPSDTVVIVEIDPKSLQEEDRWPWPRDRYATVISHLHDAGASLIAFDIDFSSLSDNEGDAAFASALASRPGDIVLPVFFQKTSQENGAGAIIQTPPHEMFLQHSVIANVNLVAEKNGLVRRSRRGFNDGEFHRASMAAVLAGAPSTQHDAYYIDYSINPNKIDRLSFSDALNGAIPESLVQGKKILIGATATELGDEFAAPIWGMTPGVVLHALSYETLLQQRALVRPHPHISLVLSLMVILLLCRSGGENRRIRTAAIHIALTTMLICGPLLVQANAPISFDVGSILAAQFLSLAYITAAKLQSHAQLLFRQKIISARFQELTTLVVRDNFDGVIVANAQGVVELCNDRAGELLGADNALKPDAKLLEITEDFPLYSSNRTDCPASASTVRSGQSIHSEYVVKSREDVTLEIAASPSSRKLRTISGPNTEIQEALFVYTLRDISARKRIEAAEKSAMDAAVAANKLKTELISNMNHELRTPLNGVIGFADILRKESFGPLGTPEYQVYSENIYVSGQRLLGLVSDMMNISKLESESFEICKSWMNIDEAIENCLGVFDSRTTQEGKPIHVKVEQDIPAAEIDLSIFNEIISHLLSNAVKYTGDDGHILIRARRRNDELVIEIADNGCGADPVILPKLTQAFYQGDSALNRRYEGAGLGLYLVAKYVSLHGGTLEFESKETVGFVARLRFAGMISDKRQSAA